MKARFPRWMLGLLLLAGASPALYAEPYLAVRTGYPCASCHVNPTGGGLRSRFGDVYAQTQMPQRSISEFGRAPWLGDVGEFLRVGGDLRADASFTDVPHEKRSDAFALQDFRLYGAADLIRDRLALYLDQRLAPGGSQTREAYALLWWDRRQFYLKAGRMYLPYGLRLQDDETLVRRVTGINYTTPDNGAELGWLAGRWNAQLAVSNGVAGGGAENDQGKQATANLVYLRSWWRLGFSFDYNDAAAGKRQLQGLFAGLRTGPIAWLGEADYIEDGSFSPRRKLWAGLLEADWSFLPGNNLRFTAEYFDPDLAVAEDQQNRFGLTWEYTPIPFLQVRLGVHRFDGIPQNHLQNRTELFAELHGFF